MKCLQSALCDLYRYTLLYTVKIIVNNDFSERNLLRSYHIEEISIYSNNRLQKLSKYLQYAK